MSKLVFALFRNLFHKSTVEQELDEELRSTVEILTEEKVRQGLSRADARREALMLLGGIEQVKEEVRSVRIGQNTQARRSNLRPQRSRFRRRGVYCGFSGYSYFLGQETLSCFRCRLSERFVDALHALTYWCPALFRDS